MSKEPSDVRKFRDRKLAEGETIVAFCAGYVGEITNSSKHPVHNGALILTDRRLAFYCKGLLKEVFEQIPLDKVTSVETKSLLGHHRAIFHTSHNELSFATGNRKELDPILSEVENRKTGGTAVKAAPTESPLDKIKKLDELRQAGILSDEEFTTKKAELLAKV